jgi:phosphatidylglycerol:prolipoprotein diacylglycerol transferase
VIPYVEVYDLKIGPMTFSVFGLLLAIAVFGGAELARRRARKRGEDVAALTSLAWWVVVVGFITAHLFDEICYHPRQVVERPWSLLFVWEGISSFGGFLGCALGALAWKYYELKPVAHIGSLAIRLPVRRAVPHPILAIGENIAAVFPTAWIFGRLGCSIVHDHPGGRATSKSAFAVAFGPGTSTDYGFFAVHHGWSPRYDLGLLELMYTVLVVVLFALMSRRKLPAGTYSCASLLLYAPVRFGLDFLRAEDQDGGDPRYFWLTPGQWAAIAMFAGGLWLLSYIWSKRASEPLASTVSQSQAASGA